MEVGGAVKVVGAVVGTGATVGTVCYGAVAPSGTVIRLKRIYLSKHFCYCFALILA